MLFRYYQTSEKQTIYSAPFCSLATVVYFGLIVAMLLLPFVFGYASSPFWLKENSYREQPLVVFVNSALVLLEGIKSTTGQPFYAQYGTDPLYQMYLGSLNRVGAVKMTQIDNNADGKPEYLEFNCTMPVFTDEQVLHVRVLFGIQIQLADRVRLMSQGLIWLDHSSPLPGGSLYADGDVVINQRNIMTDKADYIVIEPVLDFSAVKGMHPEALQWTNIMSTYMARNVITEFNSPPPIWSAFRDPGSPFSIYIRVRVPETRVVYRPSVLEVLKNGWIQYLSLLVLVCIILLPIYDLALRSNVVKTVVQSVPRYGRDLKTPIRY
ncbi:transmembrane protein [Gorgonomyces haynaldii]|nr:transmembrane protein [Gorgonomyces haynaldii]